MKRLLLSSVLIGMLFSMAGIALADEHHHRENSHDRYVHHVAKPRFSKHVNIVAQSSGNVVDDATSTLVLFSLPTATTRGGTSLSVSCNHYDAGLGGGMFPDGRSQVICSATDDVTDPAHPVTGHTHFQVWVKSTGEPLITLTFTSPTSDSSDAVFTTANPGIVVTYTAEVTGGRNDHDADDIVTCTPASGTTFLVADDTTPIICSVRRGGRTIFQETPATVTVIPADISVCTPQSVGNGSVASYPDCSISCNSGYTLSGSSCVASSNGSPSLSGGGGGGGGAGSYIIHALFPGWNTPAPSNTTAPATSGSGSTSAEPLFKLTLYTGHGDATKNAAQNEVYLLQKFLNSHGFIVAKSGPGSPGNETTAFSPALKAALIKFQEANAKAILGTPWGISKGTGIFGPATRKFINSIVVGETPVPYIPKPGETVTGNPTSGGSGSAGGTTGGTGKTTNSKSGNGKTTGKPQSGQNLPAPVVTAPITQKSCPTWLCFWR